MPPQDPNIDIDTALKMLEERTPPPTVRAKTPERQVVNKYVKEGPLLPGQQYFPDLGPGQQLANNVAENNTPASVEFAKGVWGAWEDAGKRTFFQLTPDQWIGRTGEEPWEFERNKPDSGWESIGRMVGSLGGILPADSPFTAEQLRKQSFLEQSLMAVGIPGTMSVPGFTLGAKTALSGGFKSADRIPVPTSVAVSKLREVVRSVKAQKPEQQKQISKARGERTFEAARVIEEGYAANDDAFQTFQVSLGRLKGALDHVVPNNSLANLEPSDMAELQEIIMRSSKTGRGSNAINLGDGVLIDPIDYQTNMNALTKLTLGEELLQSHEIRRMEKIFGSDFMDDTAGISYGAWNAFSDVWNLPKTLVASIDLSMAGRQGWKLALSPYWKQWVNAFGAQFKLLDPFFGELRYDIMTKSITDHKYYKFGEKYLPLMERAGTRARNITTTEDAFMSNLSRFIPGANISERAYTGALNKLRWDSFYKQLDDWATQGYEWSEADLEKLSDFILFSTGRGKVSKWLGGESPYIMEILNGAFFSPRFVAAWPNFYLGGTLRAGRDVLSQSRLLRGVDKYMTGSRVLGEEARNGQISKIWAKTLVGHAFKGAGIMSMAKLAEEIYEEDIEIGINPLASNFGQVKLGSIRYDFWGGDAQYIKFILRMWEGARVNPVTGEQIIADRGDLIRKFVRSKLSPSSSAVIDFGITGDDFYGNEIRYDKESLQEQAFQRLVFMFAQDMADVINLENSKFNSPTFAIPSFFGIGVMPYETIQDVKNNLSLKMYGVIYDDLLELPNGGTLKSDIDTHRAVVGWQEQREAKRPPRDPDETFFAGMASYRSRVTELEEGSSRSGPGLLAVLQSGAEGSVKHAAIQSYLAEKSSAFASNIPQEVEVVKEERLNDLVSIWRNRYWSVPLTIDPRTGIPDYEFQDWQQEQIIIKAQNAGIETAGMTARDLLTYNNNPSTNEDISKEIKIWRNDHDWLRENFWSLGDQLIKDAGYWNYYQLYRYSDYATYYRKFDPVFDQLLTAQGAYKQQLRRMNPEIDRKLLKWGHISSPVNEQVKLEYLGDVPVTEIMQAQPR